MYLTERLSSFIDARSMALQIPQARTIWLLADKYDCAKMVELLRSRLATLATLQPRGVFELASELDDIELARVAIASMTRQHLHDTAEGGAAGFTLWSQLSKVCLEWQIEFLRLVLPSTTLNQQTLWAPFDLSFKTIAVNFNPYST
jgi:hypothetical protein